jgi:tetratricopeptide (TPR) repeat protein
LAAGDPRAALGPLGEAAALDPEHAEGRFRLGRALLLTGDEQAAAAELLAAKELDVAPLRAIEPLIEATRRAAAEHGLPLVDLPALLAAAGHPIPGDEVLLDHVHIDVERHGLVAERVVAALAEEGVVRPVPGWTEARRREIGARLLASIDREYNALRDLNVAKVLGWAGKLEEAEPPLLRAAEVLDTADLHLNLGVLYQRTGRPAAALPHLERGVALEPAVPEGHFNLGVTLGRLGRLDEGIAALREAVRLRPDYAEAWHDLGVLLRERGDLDGALAALGRALALDPDAAAVHAALGLTYARQGRRAEADAALARAAALDPERAAGARAALALDLARAGRLDEADRELSALLAAAPSAEAWYNLGLVRARRGDPAAARAAYEEALALDPAHAPALNNLALAFAAAGDLAAARRHLEAAVRAAPAYAEAWLNLGVVLDQSGDPAGALAALERAAALDPESPRIREALELLRAHSGAGGG